MQEMRGLQVLKETREKPIHPAKESMDKQGWYDQSEWIALNQSISFWLFGAALSYCSTAKHKNSPRKRDGETG